ncbi:MAG: helix-turn-helix domain-containing protein [Acidobacteriota bacterium]|nr:helix-turn-helix domain-containing protein [Acidobacteriota bacterium]
MTKKKPSRLTSALLEAADDLHELGIMDHAAHGKITARHLGKQALATSTPITPSEVREMRERANLSQAVFARCLNLSIGYISQLERGVKKPTGPALTLLNVIRRKGIEAIL